MFPHQKIKDRALCFSTKKALLQQSFKCKLYLKNSVKLIKKNFAAARAKIFFVIRISGNKSIVFFGPIIRLFKSFFKAFAMLFIKLLLLNLFKYSPPFLYLLFMKIQ